MTSYLSSAAVVAQYLRGVEFDAGGEFRYYVGTMPAQGTYLVCLYDTAGRVDGHSQHDGEVFEHPGIQVRISCPSYPLGFHKCKELIDLLKRLAKEPVTVEGKSYYINSVTVTSPVASMGQATPNRNADFTFNLMISISSVQ